MAVGSWARELRLFENTSKGLIKVSAKVLTVGRTKFKKRAAAKREAAAKAASNAGLPPAPKGNVLILHDTEGEGVLVVWRGMSTSSLDYGHYASPRAPLATRLPATVGYPRDPGRP